MIAYREGGAWKVMVYVGGKKTVIKGRTKDEALNRAMAYKENYRRAKGTSEQLYYWMVVDLNNAELPLYIADTVKELAQWCGVQEATIRSSISRSKRTGIQTKYKQVLRK